MALSSSTTTRKWLRPVLILLILVARSAANDEMECKNGPLSAIREKYEELPDVAKVGTCAVAGFVTSRVALRTFVSAAKIAGAAFITTEVLSMSGVMDDLPSFVDDHVQTVSGVKDRVLVEASKFRQGMREAFKKDRKAALGFAGGAFVAMAV